MSDTIHIARTMRIDGELSGDSDARIEGKVHGSIRLLDHEIVIVSGASVEADVTARVVRVQGRFLGRAVADRIEVSPGAFVLGELVARQVVLADGATFRGRVDTGNRD